MMADQKQRQPKLFYHGIHLDERVGPDHPLRRIEQAIDFTFVRRRVADCYGGNGNVSVDPVIVLKLMFLLFYENVKSERELMRQLPLRLDWLWFCHYDLDEVTPHHSILSKARRRWGPAVFEQFFIQVLQQCIDAGLVDGSIIHLDSSMIAADASIDRLQPQLRRIAQQACQKLDEPPMAPDASETIDDHNMEDEAKLHRVSPVDPQARLARKYGQTTLGYKDHRTVDDHHGIMTSTTTTPANVNDDKVLKTMVEKHETHTDVAVQTAVADKAYGVIDNYQYLHGKGSTACIPHQRRAHKKDKLPQEAFRYDAEDDCYVCPAGQQLLHARYVSSSRAHEYRGDRKTCQACPCFADCVTSTRYGRTISRHEDSGYIEWADQCLPAAVRRRLLRRRRAKAEGSFADAANNHRFKQCRWRGLIPATIQNLMIAAVQNLRKLLRYSRQKFPAEAGISCTLRQQRVAVSLFGLLERTNNFAYALMSQYLLLKEPHS